MESHENFLSGGYLRYVVIWEHNDKPSRRVAVLEPKTLTLNCAGAIRDTELETDHNLRINVSSDQTN